MRRNRRIRPPRGRKRVPDPEGIAAHIVRMSGSTRIYNMQIRDNQVMAGDADMTGQPTRAESE